MSEERNCVNICYNLINIKKRNPELLSRTGPTKEHNKAWEAFNYYLELRSNVCMFDMAIFNTLTSLGNSAYH